MSGKRIASEKLYKLRNHVPVHRFMSEELKIPVKYSEGFHRFQCPLCKEMQTAVKLETNLGRCFRCSINFNPIDITMAIRNCSFLQAVEIVQSWLKEEPCPRF